MGSRGEGGGGGGEEGGGVRGKYKDWMENKMLEAFMCFYSERQRKARYKLGHIQLSV